MNNNSIDILLIEDDLLYAKSIKRVLKNADNISFNLTHADCLTEGMACFVHKNYDLILLDLGLPESQGIDTIKNILNKLPNTPTIVLTGESDETLAISAVKIGAQDYLVKGHFTHDLLIRAIRYAIQRHDLFINLKESRAQLIESEKMRTISMMAAGLAHELNNPMMGLLNFTQYCLKQTMHGDKTHHILQHMEKEINRCIELVRNLVTFAQVKGGKKEKYQQESCQVVIERVLKLLSHEIEGQHISLSVHIHEKTPDIWMKTGEIQTVCLNIILNALEAVEQSDIKEIKIDVTPKDDFVHLTIIDSGCGIAPDIQSKIFKPFFTTKLIDKRTGIGLTISQRIIKEHNGKIEYNSEPGKGSKFTILLPINMMRD